MITHLVDTDICIEALRRRNPALSAHFIDLDAALAVSAVTVSELHFGALRSADPARNAAAVREFLGMLEVLPLEGRDAESAAAVRAELAGLGTPIGGYDLFIAGQARTRSLILVTGNVSEFDRVDGLRVEDWSGRG